jgi:hypothetical protein
VRRFSSRKTTQYQLLTSSVLNPRSREVWRITGRETEFWATAALSQCGGLGTKVRFIGNMCGLANQRRMLGADGLAEGEELGSNVLQVARRTPANCSETQGHAPTLQPREVTRKLSLEFGEVARDRQPCPANNARVMDPCPSSACAIHPTCSARSHAAIRAITIHGNVYSIVECV